MCLLGDREALASLQASFFFLSVAFRFSFSLSRAVTSVWFFLENLGVREVLAQFYWSAQL